jgi:hypothetical protein
MSLRFVEGEFLLDLAIGMGLASPWLAVRAIGRTYHQFFAILVGCLWILSAWLLQTSWLGYAGAVTLTFAALFSLPMRWRGWVVTFSRGYLLVASACSVILVPAFGAFSLSLHGLLERLSATSVLGLSAVALTLGHWYLVAPGLSFGVLTRYVTALLIALVFRTGWVFFQYLESDATAALAEPWVWMRVAFGIVAPLIFSAMALRTLHYRHNQAATGILYVVVVLLFIAELVHGVLQVGS